MRDAISCRMVVLSRRDLCSKPLLCQINYFLLRILLPQGLPEAPRISQEAPRISQGAPWSPLGRPKASLCLQRWLETNLGGGVATKSEQKWWKGCSKLRSRNSSPAAAAAATAAAAAKTAHRVLLGASLPHAPGVRMTWVRTNSLKQFFTTL